MTLRRHTAISLIAAAWLLLILLPRQASALPQFARRYNLKCSACHTIVPVLNEQGELFQRLGYHLPPALQPSHAVSKLSAVPEGANWTLTNNASFAVTDFSYSAERTTQEGQTPSSTSASK